MTIKIDTDQQFYAKIHKQSEEKRFPLRAMFELTYRCNFNCLHCYVTDKHRKESQIKDLKTDEIFSIIDQLKEMGCFYLGFTGGEPFVREDILDILWYAKSKGFEIIIYTNGSLIDVGVADELEKLKPNKVDITVNSLKKEPFERIVLSSNSHKRVFRAIELLYERDIPLGFKSCVLKENEDDIDNIREFAKSQDALHRLDDILMPRLDGSKEPYSYRGKLKQKNPISLECNEEILLKEKEISQKRSRLFYCNVGLNNLVINPFGEIRMCVGIDYPRYSIFDTSLKECWQKLKKFIDNIGPDENYKCETCKLEPYCHWCPARSWYQDGSFTSCDPECRKQAENLSINAAGKKFEPAIK